MRKFCWRVSGTFPRKCFEFLSLSDLISCILVNTYKEIHLSGVKFVERRSLLSSEHSYFANIYTQKGTSLRGQKAVTGGLKEGLEAFGPPVIQLKKALKYSIFKFTQYQAVMRNALKSSISKWFCKRTEKDNEYSYQYPKR